MDLVRHNNAAQTFYKITDLIALYVYKFIIVFLFWLPLFNFLSFMTSL